MESAISRVGSHELRRRGPGIRARGEREGKGIRGGGLLDYGYVVGNSGNSGCGVRLHGLGDMCKHYKDLTPLNIYRTALGFQTAG